MSVMERIRAEGLQRSQLPQTLSYLTDVIGPRLTGSPGLIRANEWTRAKMAEWGLINAHQEEWGPFGRGWTLERFSMEVISPTPFPVIGLMKAWSPAWSGTADAVYLEAAETADLDKYKGQLKGKIVLISPIRTVNAHFTPEGQRITDERLQAMANPDPNARRGGFPGGGRFGQGARGLSPAQLLAFAKTEGAAAVLDSARGDGGTIFVQQASVPVTGTQTPTPRPTGQPPAGRPAARSVRYRLASRASERLLIPQIAVSVEHYNRIARMLQAGEPVKIALQSKVRFNGDDDSKVANTVAEIAGSDKADEVVMVGGHMDSWHGGTGATDNAAGVSVAMEAVRILKALGIQPRRTIRVGLWTGEEQGIFGSAEYVKAHFGARGVPTAEHAKFAAYFNLDNGTGKIRGVYCQGNEGVMPIFAEWLKPFGDLGASTITRSTTGGTDHLSFDSVGLPGFQFIQDSIEYDTRTHHSTQDVFDRIQIEDMKQSATIMAAFLYNAAMREEKLPRKPAPAPAPVSER